MTSPAHSRIDRIAIVAFVLLVVACYLPFLNGKILAESPWRSAATFVLGAAYVASVLFRSSFCATDERGALRYLLAECGLLTVMLAVSPLRGFFFLIVLPIVSEAVFELPWKKATAIVVYLFAVSLGVIVWSFGTRNLLDVSIAYAAAFAFTIAFSVIGYRSVAARDRAETLTAELEAANQQLRAHAAEAEKLATIQERNRLAREIHDGVGHYLTVIKVQLDAATALLPADPARAADSVAKAARLAGDALDDVRRSVGSLAVDGTPPPLGDALRALAADAAPVPALRIEGTPRPLSAGAEHALFRTAQEGLTNLRKHAHATAAELTLDFRDPARVRLTLRDNGRGAPHASIATDDKGYGLRGLRERLALLGGNLAAGNVSADGGFSLSADVPA